MTSSDGIKMSWRDRNSRMAHVKETGTQRERKLNLHQSESTPAARCFDSSPFITALGTCSLYTDRSLAVVPSHSVITKLAFSSFLI